MSLLSLLSLLMACSNTKAPTCTIESSRSLQTCVADYSARLQECVESTGGLCDSNDASLQNILTTLEQSTLDSCAEGTDFNMLTAESLSSRLTSSCESQSSAMAWRVFGGPQADVWSESDVEGQTCLSSLYEVEQQYVNASLETINTCFEEDCGSNNLDASRSTLRQETASALLTTCSPIEDIIGINSTFMMKNLDTQIDCLTATGHSNTEDHTLSCGPSNAEFEVKRGEWQQIIVDSDKWGTLCGDGTDFAFHVRFAPEGNDLDNVLVGLQGGGVCVFEEDCTAKLEGGGAGLFNAQDDVPYAAAISDTDPTVSPFANWTQVYIPYCNQDVFAGGGVIEDLGELQLPRYGAVNMRAAVQMVRDVIWKEMDATTTEGFRSDDVHAFFGGWSAGAYGTNYNYHWFLDDLLWPKTTAFPDAGLALHNGETLGVMGLGLLKIPIWGTQNYLPPYCFQGECAVGPILSEALSKRIKQVPEQQMLMLSNPKDDVQMGDAYFQDEVFWINTMRETYCDTKDLNGIHYFLTSVSDESIHCVSVRPELWDVPVDGITMKEWFELAINDPDSVSDQAEEADFTTDIPGVLPFECEVGE